MAIHQAKNARALQCTGRLETINQKEQVMSTTATENIASVELGTAPDAASECVSLTDLRFEGKPVRIVDREDNDVWFVGADVCRALDMADVTSALRVLDADEKGPLTVRTPGGNQILNGISEPGLYKLIARSRKPEAKRFDRWVRHEVLPSIRKTGSYVAAAVPQTREQIIASALLLADETIQEQKAQIAVLAPKAEALDRIAAADGSFSVTEAAKALQVRPKDLFNFLSSNGWTYRRAGSGTWLGYQSRTTAGDLEHRVNTVLQADGTERVFEQVKVTAKGLTKLAKLMPGRAVTA